MLLFYGDNEADKDSQCCKDQRGKTALCGMQTRTPSTVRVEEGGRKVEGVKIL